MSPSEMDGDLKKWGEIADEVKGLSALGFPSGLPETPSGKGVPVPDYFPNHQIQALDNAIEGLEGKHKNLLILRYVYGISYEKIGKEIGCYRETVTDKINEIKHLLVKSKYWKT